MVAEHRHELTLQSGMAAAGEASVWVRTLAEQYGLPIDWKEGLDLSAVELVSNIVDYAYAGEMGEIRLELVVAGTAVEFVLEDDGPAFDPLGQAEPRRPATLDEAPIGGYGIHLVRQFATRCQYERVEQANRLTVTFGERKQHTRRIDRRQRTAATFPVVRANSFCVDNEERNGVDRRALGFISRTDLFRNVPYQELEFIVAGCRLGDFAAGDLILAAAQQGSSVWVVVEGKLRVHLDRPDSDDFLEIPCGECVGEISVADGKLSTAWVVAATDCRLLEIDADVFLQRLLTIPQVGRNLIIILAERMRRSNQRISERVRLAEELKALQRELDFARRIQASMLPSNPLFAEDQRIDCYGFMRAARQVGGDFYDAMQIDADTYLVAIGDVCNKGMPAALFMAQTLALLRSLASRGRIDEHSQMAELVGLGNDELCRANSEQLFVSVFLALIDLKCDVIRYVNAGHNPPLLVLPGEAPCFVEMPRNPVAGMVPGIHYQAGQCRFTPGSVLLLYTDGITEAETADNQQFGEDALVACLADTSKPAAALSDEIVCCVDRFSGVTPQADDITLLVVRRP